VRAGAVPGDFLSSSASSLLWNTSRLRNGRVRLRLRLASGRRAIRGSSSFRLDQPPHVGKLVATFPPQNPAAVSFSAPDAKASGGRHLSFRWYLGDGGTATGPTPTHFYAPGSYVVTLVVTDRRGCASDGIHLYTVSAPSSVRAAADQPPPYQPDVNEAIPEVDWCDPLSVDVKYQGQSDQEWNNDWLPQARGIPKGKIGLGGKEANPKMTVGFAFEVSVAVLGNPAKCRAEQLTSSTITLQQTIKVNGKDVVRTFHQKLPKGSGALPRPVAPEGDFPFVKDDYSEDVPGKRMSIPGANGISNITWLDVPSVPAPLEPNITNVQKVNDFIALVSGQEAPIAHTEIGGPSDGESAFGETAALGFTTCAVWKPPPGKNAASIDIGFRGGPDSKYPPGVKISDKPYGPSEQVGNDQLKGCGTKP
jgi:hypothetical protein